MTEGEYTSCGLGRRRGRQRDRARAPLSTPLDL